MLRLPMSFWENWYLILLQSIRETKYWDWILVTTPKPFKIPKLMGLAKRPKKKPLLKKVQLMGLYKDKIAHTWVVNNINEMLSLPPTNFSFWDNWCLTFLPILMRSDNHYNFVIAIIERWGHIDNLQANIILSMLPHD